MKKLFNTVVINSLPRAKIWAIIFIVGIMLGYGFYGILIPYITPMLQKTYEVLGNVSLSDMGTATSIIVIFLKNALIAFLCILTARLTFGIYPMFVVMFNGLAIGFFSKMLTCDGSMTIMQVIGGLAPHGVFEICGIILACAIGFLQIPMISKLRSSALIWILLLIAAVVESTVTVAIVATY